MRFFLKKNTSAFKTITMPAAGKLYQDAEILSGLGMKFINAWNFE